MPGITISQDNTAALRDKFRELCQWNTRDSEEVAFDQFRKLAYDLYAETAAIAPTKAQIRADVIKQGWEIPEKFADGRLGRGKPEQWEKYGYVRASKRILKGKRGRRSAADQAKIDRAVAKQKKLEAMERFVIARRIHARLYTASGWLGGIRDLGGSLKITSGDIALERGGARVYRGAGRLEAEIWNNTPEIVDVDNEKHFVAKAMARRAADMQVYIDRKKAQLAAIWSRKAA